MKNKKSKIINNKLALPRPLPIQPEELEILSPRKKMTVAEWALNRRVLSPKTSNYAGSWSHDFTPWAVRIMEKLSEAGTKQVTVMACVQSSKTEIGLNFFGWIIEESPGPALIVMPREDDTNRRINTRIKPMFQSTKSLMAHLPAGKLENINTGKETVLDNMILFIGWAGSAAALADNPVCYVWLDEVGKFPARTGKEADPVSLAKDRQTTFFARSKLYCDSTPVKENDLIDREFKAGDMEELWFKCPACGGYHLPDWFENVKLDHDNEGHLFGPEEYESGGHARYICPACKENWTEKQRWQAVSDGIWAPEGCTVERGGKIVGKIVGNVPITTHYSFRVHAMMLYPGFMTIDRLAVKWAEAILAKKTGDIGPLQDFYNSYLARPFEEREKETAESILVKHVGTYKSGTVPAGVQMLTAGFDVQFDHIWFVVDGWGFMSEAWGIAEGRLETGDTSLLENYRLVEELLAAPWPLENRDAVGIIYRAAIDCNYRPDVVKDLCVRHNDVLIPVRGDDSVRSRVFRASRETITIGASRINLIRYDLNTNVIKDRLYRLLYETDIPGPGYMHLHAETTDETFEQFASEEKRKIKNGRHFEDIWMQKGSRPNHLWDCRVYSALAAELAGARFLQDPNAAAPAARQAGAEIKQTGTKKIRIKY
ncbi:MAG: terminase gpA endonuclease subunit [Sedimentisphaerales bacterium]